MKLSEYILLPREQRLAHTDLTQPCYLVDKIQRHGKNNLVGYLGLEDDKPGRKVHCCHLCENNSRADFKCINPAHLYFGSPRENQLDIPDDIRQLRLIRMTEAAIIANSKKTSKKTPEERSANTRKGWNTRRQNNSQNTHL